MEESPFLEAVTRWLMVAAFALPVFVGGSFALQWAFETGHYAVAIGAGALVAAFMFMFAAASLDIVHLMGGAAMQLVLKSGSPRVGHAVEGHVSMAKRLTTPEAFRVTIACRVGKWRREVRWTASQETRPVPWGEELLLFFRFDVPDGLPGSVGFFGEKAGTPCRWSIEARPAGAAGAPCEFEFLMRPSLAAEARDRGHWPGVAA